MAIIRTRLLEWRFLHLLRPVSKSAVFFYLFGNPDIRVPWDVSGVPVAMGSGRGVVYETKSGGCSRFCEAGSRNIR
ncbi:hypothetical protein NDU88_002236 [Pleurodeles waltl]|uniref:Uncharacterized protein n=1 Tax=Pleurodeles waltl TaxID=8319 RepID=A0AAV7W1L8_PLEWA|nr:hypothetical protein NDU88_002236 [Pleurodeles waltl]